MKSPPSQLQSQNQSKNDDEGAGSGCGNNLTGRTTSKSSNHHLVNGATKVGKQQLVSLNGDSICCESIESEEALACDVTPLPVLKPKTKALCVHIRENKWYDAGNVVSVGVAGAGLNNALESMSLTLSPTTKQLYSFDEINQLSANDLRLDVLVADSGPGKEELQNSGNNSPRGSLPRSCSSTVSSLSECSASSGFLNNNDESQISPGKSSTSSASKLWPLGSSFMKNVFSSWKTKEQQQQQQQPENQEEQQQLGACSPTRNSDKIGGSLALIQQCRPAYLPAKSASEEENHRRQYEAILEAARRREQREERERRLQRELQLREEARLAEDSATWTSQVLPKFDALRETRRVRELWWRGLPPSIRGRVWRLAIGNSLNVTSQLYELCLERAQACSGSTSSSSSDANGPHSECITAIRLDVTRTFPMLCVFQEGGPLSESLQGILAAYAVYRPDIGYVQGMSFIGAVLALNMDAPEAFICFANLLNRPCHLAAFSLDQQRMAAYYRAYSSALANRLPKLHAHFLAAGLSPDLYLLDWVYTIYAKAMPLDVACRVWDLFMRDGDEFLFRTALGVLHLYQDELLAMDFVRAAQFLTRLPENMHSDALFNSISQVSTSVGGMTFQQMIVQISESL